jgi:nucleoside-diphosphate-sugar epimerase
MARVAVTGGRGKLGQAVVSELLAHAWDVYNFDQAPPAQRRSTSPTRRLHRLRADFSKHSQASIGTATSVSGTPRAKFVRRQTGSRWPAFDGHENAVSDDV